MKEIAAFLLAVFLLLPANTSQAQEPPSTLVEAIAWQESGLNPLAVNVAGKSYSPTTREEAEQIIRQAITAGKSFDVGLMQINSWWMERYGIPPESLLDPAINEAWGRWILAQEIARHGFNWQAVGKYHSPDTERGRQYAWHIYRHYAGQSASIPKEAQYAHSKAYSQNISHAGGVWRNSVVSRQGRVITFDLQQKSVPGVSGTESGARGVPAGTATP